MNSPEQDDLDPIVARLERERPIPRASFRGELERRLTARIRVRQLIPRPRLLAAAYAGSGTLLLAFAAIGLAGIGPFAA